MLSVLRHALFGLLFAASAAYAEPSIDQIYQAAHGGNLAVAQSMIDEVLKAHPQSAKAHFVQAELYARAGKVDEARAALARAETLKPGLGFARPEAVQALQRQLGAAPVAAGGTSAPVESSPLAGGNGVKTFLLIAGGVVLVVWLVRRMNARPSSGPGDMNAYGPGAAPGYGPGPAGPGYGPGAAPGPGYGPGPTSGYGPGYGPGHGPAPGMGGGIARGLATGAAVGAGLVAGQALAHHMMDGGEHGRDVPVSEDPRERLVDVSAPDDLGGQDFGINDTASWDDDSGSSSWD